MSNLRTEGQLADDFKHDDVSVDAVRDWLLKAKLKPAHEFPYGKGMARLYDKDKAYEVIRQRLAARKPPKVKPQQSSEQVAPPADLKYLVGL